MDTPVDTKVYEPDIHQVIEKCKKRLIQQSNNKIIVPGFKSIDNLNFRGVTKNNSLHFLNCEDSSFEIESSVVNIMLEGCKNVKINFTKVVAKLEILNCRDICLNVKESPNVIQIDFSSSIKIYCAEENDTIFYTCYSDLVEFNNNKIKTSLENTQVKHIVD